MSWLFSQALVADCLHRSCSGGERSALLNWTGTADAFWSQDRMIEHSDTLSQYGMTFVLLTADHGKGVLTLYLAGFPAKTSVQPERERESPETGQECGFTWPESWAKYDPVSCSWKTRQCSVLGGLEPFSETWPRWGTMQNGEFWELSTLALHTSETEFGLLPTPTTQDNVQIRGEGAAASHGKRGTTLAGWVTMWPTKNPADCNAQNGGRLNPTWVEWLMGWPLGWTDLRPLETDRFQQWQQQHGGC
jgi:hypothetical protein